MLTKRDEDKVKTCVINNTYNDFLQLDIQTSLDSKDIHVSNMSKFGVVFVVLILILIIILILIVFIRLWLTEDDEADGASAACIRTVSIVTGYWKQDDYGDTHRDDDDD